MGDNDVLIQIRGDVADINAKLADLRGNIGKVSEANRKMGEDSKNSWAILSAGIASAYYLVEQFIGKITYFTNTFMESESAAMKLAVAMRNQGDYTKEAFEELEDYAKQIQETTRYEDDFAMSIMGNLKTYGMTNEELKKTIPTILDFATAKRTEGMSVESASELIGKAYVGQTDKLKRYGIVVDQTLSSSEKYNQVLKQLNDRFGGAAQADLETYAGRVQRIKNIFGDIAEVIGQTLLKAMEAVMFAFSMLSVGFWTVVESINKALTWLAEKTAAVADFLGLEGIKAASGELAKQLREAGTEYTAIKDKALAMADSNYKAMMSFDKVDEAVSRMKPGKRFKPPGDEDEGNEKLRTEWAKTARELQADIDKVNMDPFEQKLVDIAKKVKDLRDKADKLPTQGEKDQANKLIGKWSGMQEDSASSEWAGKDFEIVKMAEKAWMDLANKKKAFRESEINMQLSELDLAEKLGTAHEDTINRRIELQRELVKIQEEHLQQLDKIKDPTGWYAQKAAVDNALKSLTDLTRESQLRDPFGAIRLGITDILNRYSNFGQQLYTLTVQIAQGMERAFSDFFFDLFTNNLKSIEDYARSFLTSLQRAIADYMAKMLMYFIIQKTITTVASSFGHQGGMGWEIAPSFHGGRGPGEFNTTLRNDETVLTPGQMNALVDLIASRTGPGRELGREAPQSGGEIYNIYVQALDSRSFDEFTKRNPQAIIAPFREALRNNTINREMNNLIKGR